MTPIARRLVFAQAVDAGTFCLFFLLVGQSVHVERNPIMAVPMALGGIALAAALKMGYVGLVAWRSGRFAQTRKLVVAVSVATASGIAGAGFNAASTVNDLTGFHLGGVAAVLAPLCAPLGALADAVRALA